MDYAKDDPLDSRVDDRMDDLGVNLKDDLKNDPGDRSLDGLGNDLMNDLMDDLRNHGTNPRPFARPRNFPGFRHLGRGDSFGCSERLSGVRRLDRTPTSRCLTPASICLVRLGSIRSLSADVGLLQRTGPKEYHYV